MSDTTENVRIVAPPLQWQLAVIDGGREKHVAILLRQGGWQAQLMLAGNDAITLAQQLRTKGKEAGSGITRVAALVGADGQPIATAPDESESE